MKIQKSAVNLLLAGEGLLLVAVLVFGLITGAAGLLKTPQEGADNQVGKNTEGINSEDVNHSEAGSEGDSAENLKWTVPENFVEERITFSETVEAMLANMSTEQKVAQPFLTAAVPHPLHHIRPVQPVRLSFFAAQQPHDGHTIRAYVVELAQPCPVLLLMQYAREHMHICMRYQLRCLCTCRQGRKIRARGIQIRCHKRYAKHLLYCRSFHVSRYFT